MLKKVLTSAVLGVSALGVMAANAAAPGVYVTGQLGYAKSKSLDKHDYDNIHDNLNNSGLAGRLAIGYQFNQYWATELGYLQLKKATVAIPAIGQLIPGTETSKQNAIDLVGKGILPVSDKINVYGKLGLAYLTSDLNLKEKSGKKLPNNADYGIAKHKWAPEAAVGVSYDITHNVSIDTSWTHIQPLGKNRPGNIDFVAVGLGYSFG